MTQPIVNVVIQFSRRTIECDKIALRSLIEIKPQNGFTTRAIARLSAKIAMREKILRERTVN